MSWRVLPRPGACDLPTERPTPLLVHMPQNSAMRWCFGMSTHATGRDLESTKSFQP